MLQYLNCVEHALGLGDWAKLHGATLLAINDKDRHNSSAAPPPFLFSFVLLDWLCGALHAQPCHADSTFGLTGDAACPPLF